MISLPGIGIKPKPDLFLIMFGRLAEGNSETGLYSELNHMISRSTVKTVPLQL